MILDILKMAQKWPKILTRIVGSDDVRGKRNDECEQGDYDTMCGGRSHDETRQRQARESDLCVDFNLLMLMIVWVVMLVYDSG